MAESIETSCKRAIGVNATRTTHERHTLVVSTIGSITIAAEADHLVNCSTASAASRSMTMLQ